MIGVPKKGSHENRIAIIPGAVPVFLKAGHKVLIEKGAGKGSGIEDEEFLLSGAEIVPTVEEIYEQADMIYKVKEPQPSEYDLLREGQIIFAYLHLAAEPEVARALWRKGSNICL